MSHLETRLVVLNLKKRPERKVTEEAEPEQQLSVNLSPSKQRDEIPEYVELVGDKVS